MHAGQFRVVPLLRSSLEISHVHRPWQRWVSRNWARTSYSLSPSFRVPATSNDEPAIFTFLFCDVDVSLRGRVCSKNLPSLQGTIKSRLLSMSYTTPEEFASDVRLVFTNAIGFNPESHFVHTWAVQLLSEFDVSTRGGVCAFFPIQVSWVVLGVVMWEELRSCTAVGHDDAVLTRSREPLQENALFPIPKRGCANVARRIRVLWEWCEQILTEIL